jgi:hypothetical protein
MEVAGATDNFLFRNTLINITSKNIPNKKMFMISIFGLL